MRNPMWRFVYTISLIWICAIAGSAERLPVRQYTVADGLAQGTVWNIHQDAHGFLWLATSDGLSRFDGYRFTNYKKSEGLNYFRVYDVTADRQGRIWMATGEGVSQLLDATEAARQGKKFNNFLLAADDKSADINITLRVLFDAENRLLALTYAGLFRAKSAAVVTGQFERIAEFDVSNMAQVMLDRRGRIWAAVNQQLRCIAGGNVITYELWQAGETKGLPALRWVKGLVELSDGRIQIATNKDLYEFIEPAATGQRGSWRRLPFALPPQNLIGTIHAAADGGLWIGTDGDLIRYRDGRQVSYRISNDTNSFNIVSFHSDRDGNLWIGTRQRGLLKLKGEAISVYDAGDGLGPVMNGYELRSETHEGRMTLMGRPVSPIACNETFLTNSNAKGAGGLTHLQPPPSLCLHDLIQDSRKNWWALRFLAERNTYKLYFMPGPGLNFSAGYELTAADGWVDGGYSQLYEDYEGYIWLRKGSQIFRVEYTKGGRPRIVEIVKAGTTGAAIHFYRDQAGSSWWTEGGTVWRLHQGKIDTIALPVEKPRPRSFFMDRKGCLWIGTIEHGVLMTAAPHSAQPRFVNYTAAHGLGHHQVNALCEDDDGNMWFGTVLGLYRLNEQTGRFHFVSPGEFPLGSAISDLRKDRQGQLWASVAGAVYRFNPRLLPRPASQVPVYLSRVSLAGEPLALGETGAVNLAPLELAAGRNNLEIEFVSPNFQDENAVRYQYKLDGVDADWGEPGNAREVNYARLAPGSYRFLARAVNENGTVSAEAASLPFVILRPLWQRWWFLAALVSALGALVYGGYRYRLNQAVKVERVRTRIAHDLHDDIGANLTRISILSEVAKQQQSNGAPPPGKLLDSIADISRESVASMNDIVWAISPEHDSLLDLTRRMRRHAEEVFTTRDIKLDFQAPDSAGELKLDVEMRRDLYLIFKEAVNNAARHAACSAVSIEVRAGGAQIFLAVSDDGKGFDPAELSEGHGLLSMRNRAGSLGGDLVIESEPGKGSRVRLTIPV